MKILITGSKGVVGSKLIKLLEKEYEVFGIDLYHSIGEIGWEHPMSTNKHNYERCDISNYRQLERIFVKVGPFDYVYNTAAEFGRWNGEDYYEQLWKSNAIGTKNIIRLQEKYGFKLIHFSSSEVYGDFEDIMSEDVMNNTPIKQMNDYAISKWVNELQIRNSIIQHSTKTVIVRLFNTYGPGEWYHPYRSVNSKFCYNLLHGIPITVYKNYYRTSLYLDDCVLTLSNIINNFKSSEVYNIGGIEYHSIEDLAKLIQKYAGANDSLIDYKDNEILTTAIKKVDITKAIRDLGHNPKVGIKEGIKNTIDWMRKYYNK